ncbi:MAG TPA: tetratricopeptide repeat protein [Planctomicrobium sp.]|nr:tetratricopeptide repeat protein [Planctomicrobium sp.]
MIDKPPQTSIISLILFDFTAIFITGTTKVPRMKYRTATCLLLCATAVSSCRSTSGLAFSKARTPGTPVLASEQTESVAKPATSPSGGSLLTLEERIQAGQSEVGRWYDDQQPHHLSTARLHFETVLAQRPQDSNAHHGLAIIADLEKNFPAAERHYQQALIQNPGNSEVLGDLGYSYLLQNRLSESERYTQMALQANPNNQNAVRHLGDVYARQGKTQQAQEIYARILPAAEVQKALAENAPRPEQANPPPALAQAPQSPSLIDRLMPNRNPGERITGEIQKKQQEYREEQARRAGQQPPLHRNGPPSDARLSREALLRDQMAEIDREATRQHRQTGPILLDDQAHTLTRLPGGDSATTWSHGANQPMSTMSTMMPFNEAPSYGAPPHAMANGASLETPPQFAEDRYSPSNHQMDRHEVTSSAPATLRGLQPWSGLPVSANQADQNVTPQQARPTTNVNHAYGQDIAASPYGPAADRNQYERSQYNQNQPERNQIVPTVSQETSPYFQNEPQRNFDPRNQAGFPPAGVGQPAGNFSGQQAVPSQNPQDQGVSNGQDNSFHAASKTAARLGMGLAPGSIYSQAAPINPPGSMSYDSLNVPAPQRVMPDDRPIQNLNQAYDPFTTQGTPVNSTPGAPHVPVNAPMYTRDQYNSPTRFDAQTFQNSSIPKSQWDAMKPYEAQRWEAGQQANHAVQQVWAQGPVNSPLSPSAGSQYSYPTTNGPTFTPNPPPDSPSGTIPPEWPYAQRAVPSPSVIAAERANPRAPGVELPQYLEQQKQQQRQQQNSPMANSTNRPQQQNSQQFSQQQQQFQSNMQIPPSYRPNGSVNANSAQSADPMNDSSLRSSGYPSGMGMQQPGQPQQASQPSQYDQAQWPTIRPR